MCHGQVLDMLKLRSAHPANIPSFKAVPDFAADNPTMTRLPGQLQMTFFIEGDA